MSHKQDALADRQQQLIAMIYGLQKAAPKYSEGFARGLQVYQNNLLATAARALSISYPVIEQLLGHVAMTVLARMLLQSSPPATGDWADWGGDLKELLLTSSLIEEHPYLADMAQLEWAVHNASRSAHRPLVQASLSHLADTPVERIGFCLADSVQVMASDFPVDIIWRAHQPTEESLQLDSDLLARELQQHQGRCHLIIHRQGNAPRLQRISDAEYAWCCDVLQGNSLGQLLDRHPQFDFSHWLSNALENQWIEQLVEIN
ncbi:hypothetical protein R50073_16650 [Maricurvus nonylphenolicus]|uniref:HvfC/BufC family peptide modification chaperone n=1 Tax=Maricurvus nonylphenolicus TaxID=1008307 RepID=UPI0036F3118F